jgi:hypothetical protein
LQRSELEPLFQEEERIVVPEERAGTTISGRRENSGSRGENWNHYFRKKRE